jgi:hypothetical protein
LDHIEIYFLNEYKHGLRYPITYLFAGLLHFARPSVLSLVLAVDAGEAVAAQAGFAILTSDPASAIAFDRKRMFWLRLVFI